MATHKRTVSELSQTELAIATGVSIPTVRLRLAQPPAIEPSRTDGRTLWYAAPTALARILGPGTRAADGDGAVLDLAAERARLARVQADGQSMKNEAQAGQLLRRDEVKAVWARRTLSWKERIRSVPVVALGRVAGLTKPMAREIAALIDETLVELADGTPTRRTVRKHRARKAAAP